MLIRRTSISMAWAMSVKNDSTFPPKQKTVMGHQTPAADPPIAKEMPMEMESQIAKMTAPLSYDQLTIMDALHGTMLARRNAPYKKINVPSPMDQHVHVMGSVRNSAVVRKD
jgi:hypothetical protein